jgi:hypothetical protein
LVVSANYFKNSALNNSASIPAFTNLDTSIFNLLRTNYKAKGDPKFQNMPDAYPREILTPQSYTDVTSQGYELSITFNPSRNWRLLVTGSSNTAKNTNLYPDAYAWELGPNQYSAFATVPTWQRFVTELQKVAQGQASSQFSLNPADPVARQQATSDAATLNGWVNSIIQQMSDTKATEGLVASPAESTLDSVVTYSFTQEKLKGLSMGLNARWRSGGVGGYQRLPNTATGTPQGIIDVNRPLRGDASVDIGSSTAYQWKLQRGVTTRIQFNVENLFNFQKPLLRSVGMDSNGVYGTPYAYVPMRWELRRPRELPPDSHV